LYRIQETVNELPQDQDLYKMASSLDAFGTIFTGRWKKKVGQSSLSGHQRNRTSSEIGKAFKVPKGCWRLANVTSSAFAPFGT
jgi:hypothetical protein